MSTFRRPNTVYLDGSHGYQSYHIAQLSRSQLSTKQQVPSLLISKRFACGLVLSLHRHTHCRDHFLSSTSSCLTGVQSLHELGELPFMPQNGRFYIDTTHKATFGVRSRSCRRPNPTCATVKSLSTLHCTVACCRNPSLVRPRATYLGGLSCGSRRSLQHTTHCAVTALA